MTTDHYHNRVVIRGLLLEGFHASSIAKKMGLTRQAIAKHIRKLVEDGEIKAISGKPTFYVRVLKNPMTTIGYSQSSMTTDKGGPTMLPHHYGGVFAMVGQPRGLKYIRGLAHETTPTHAAQFGQHKAQIWLKSFYGSNPQEVRKNAHSDLLALAAQYEEKYQIRLTFLHTHRGTEWAMTDQETSDSIAAANNLKKGEEMVVDGVRHKNGDSSHDTMEYISTPANPNGADKHADANHFVYSGQLAKTLAAIGDAIITINQRVMALEEKKNKN